MAETQLETRLEEILQLKTDSLALSERILGGTDTTGTSIDVDLENGNVTVEGTTLVFESAPEPELPYTELEYIGFTGTQYINTEIIPSNHKVIVNYSQEAYYSDDHLFGTGCANDYNYFSFTFYNNNHYTIGFNGSQVQNIGTWAAGKHNLIFNSGDNHDIILDGSILYTGENTASTASLLIGRRYATRLHANIYSFQIFQRNDDTLVRDYIPVIDEHENVCLYDKVTETYFYNAGTGTFIAGPEKNSATGTGGEVE